MPSGSNAFRIWCLRIMQLGRIMKWTNKLIWSVSFQPNHCTLRPYPKIIELIQNLAVIYVAEKRFHPFNMLHWSSPHKWPMTLGHHRWPFKKAIVIPKAKPECYNWSFLGSRVVTKFHWSRVRSRPKSLFPF